MVCNTIQSMSSDYLDDRVLNEDRAEIEGHLRHCAGCVEHFEVRRRMCSNLKRLPARVPPARLGVALKMVAAQERARIALGGINWNDRLRLAFRNLMRPLALPAMGGIVSAIVLFGMIMPNISMRVRPLDDVPTGLSTDASAKYSAPMGLSESELVLDLVVDSDGRMVAYTVVSGSDLLRDASLRRQIENSLLFTEFTPATLLGGRTSGRVRVQMKSENINIRG
jgi:hypothetical protein